MQTVRCPAIYGLVTLRRCLGRRQSDDIPKRAEPDLQPMTHCDLPIEAVLGANHVTNRSKGYATPGGGVEDRQGIVSAEEEAFVNLRIVAELQQHAKTIGKCEGRDIGIEMRVTHG